MPKFDDIKPGDTLPEREYVPTNISLFLYNAAIWNAHRIHYDEIYTKEVEKHPAVVVDGPLQGDWLTQVAINWAGEDGELVSFEYSNRRASYLGEKLTSGGEVLEVDADAGTVTLAIHIKNEQGEVTSPGKAVVRLG